MEAAAIGAKVFSAYQSIQMGKAQQRMYNAQAKQAEMQAKAQALNTRTEALNHKRQGIEVLKKMLSNLATINARASAGGIDPFSGSVGNFAFANMAKGAVDFYTTTENQQLTEASAKIIEAGGAIQSAQFIGAGNMAKRQGYINAMSQLGSAAAMSSSGGGYKPGGSTYGSTPRTSYTPAGL